MANVRDRLFSGFQSRHRLHQARRRRAMTLEGLENRIVLTQLQYGLFDTGVDNSGNALGGGATDTHYTLPVTQLGTAGMNATLVSPLAGGWVPNDDTHAWIGPAADTSSAPPGTYVFETSFNAPSNGGGQLTGSITGDNDLVDVIINGVSTGYSQTNAFNGFVPFSVNGGIIAGTNTIQFVISNGGDSPNPVGFHAKDLSLNFLPLVTVDQANITASSGSSVVNSGTFADLDQGDTVTITSSRGTVQQSGTNNGTYQYFEGNVTTGGPVTITATDSRGAVSTQTFTISSIANQPPMLMGGGGASTTAQSGGQGVLVDPNVVVSDPDGPNLTTASVSISNFTLVAAEDRLLFTDQSGITGSYNNATGILTLSGSASAADYQTALRSVQYQNINPGSANTTARSISFSIAPGAFSQATGHFYEFVAAPGISWTDAKIAADARNIFGLQGYLATLTSQAENDFAFSKVQSVGWIGASDADVEGDWRWVDGPETGLLFWQGLGDGTGSAINGLYNNWSPGEPNNAGNEDYAHFLQSGRWNDYANTTPVQGYVVEYGGSVDDPVLQLTSIMQVNVANVTATPVVTSPTSSSTTNLPTATITGTAAAGSLVLVYNDTNNNGIIDAGDTTIGSEQLIAGQTDFSVDANLTANTDNHLLVSAKLDTDAESSLVVVPTITTDSLAPITPTVTSPTQPTTLNVGLATITGTAEAGSLVQIYNDSNNNGVIDDGDTLVASEQLDNDLSDYSLFVNLMPNTANHFLVNATDTAGNISTATVVPTITADSVAPVAPTVTSPTQPSTLNVGLATITGTAEAGSFVQVFNDANNNGVIDDGDTVVGSEQLDDDLTNYSMFVNLMPNTANHFLVIATDAGGNVSTATVVPTITTDSVAPVAPTVTSPTQPTTLNTSSVTLTGTVEAGSLVKVYRDTNNNGVIDDGDTLVGSEQLTADQTDYSISASLLANSANNLLVAAIDLGGNISATAVVPTITSDLIAPVVPTVLSPNQASTSNLTTVTVSGIAEKGSLVQVFNDTNNNGVIDDGDTFVASEQLENDQSHYSMVINLKPNTANHLLVIATDAGGNVSPTAVVPTLTQDSTPPMAPTPSGPTASTSTTTATSTLITGTAEAGSLVRIWNDTNGNGLVDDGEPVVGFEQLGADQTSYSINVPLALNAANHFVVTASDSAGNQSSSVALPTITQQTSIQGTVYLDSNGNGVLDAGETGLAGRVLYLDLDQSGSFTPGDVTATTDALGHFAFTGYAINTATVRELPALDATNRFFVDQTAILADGSLTLGVVPISPIAPVPVVPNPFTNNPGSTPDQRYVQSLYRTVLGRTGTDAEVAVWQKFINDGMTPTQIANGFINSPEHRMAQVESYYQTYLDRSADPSSSYWVNLLEAGISEQAVINAFINSDEYQASHTDSGSYVRDLYLDILGRQGSDQEVAAWTSSLASGQSRASIADLFVGSGEASDQIVNSDYTAYLHRQRESQSSDYWTNLLSRKISAGKVSIGILSSDEFLTKAKASSAS